MTYTEHYTKPDIQATGALATALSPAGPLAALAARRQFILYRSESSRTRPGKTDKRPLSPATLGLANAHDAANWLDAQAAVALAALCGPGHGVGFVFTPDAGMWFLDIDDCLQPDGSWSPLAVSLCQRLAGAAVEISQSGRGLHIFGTWGGPVPPHGCKNQPLGLEFYTEGRFVALTGTHASGDAAAIVPGIDAVATEYFPPAAGSAGSGSASANTPWTTEPREGYDGPEDDDELIRRFLTRSPSAKRAFEGGPTNLQLWEADATALGAAWPDPVRPWDCSSADMALASRLAFETGGNCERVERLMCRSALAAGREVKWGRPDYMHATIARPCAALTAWPGKDREAPYPVGTARPFAPGDAWPEPEPLAARLDPEPYPLDALPALMQAAVREVQNFVQAPLPMVACSALAAVSIAAQAHVDVERAAKLKGPTSLFLLTVADSGERKSTLDGFFTAPIRGWEEREATRLAPELRAHEAALAAWTAKRDGVREAIKAASKKGSATGDKEADLRKLEDSRPVAPRVPKVLRGDDTPEALAHLLATVWPSAAVASSEAGLVLGAHGMGRETIMRNLAQLNILWDGGALAIGRRTSESFTVRGARLTVALQIQEPTLRVFFDGSKGLARGTGFLARFLVCWPASTQGHRPFTEAPERWSALAGFNGRIEALLSAPAPMAPDGTLTPTVLHLAPDAKAVWVRFHDEVEGQLRTGGELADVRDVASKIADNAARIAALFHVLEHGAGGHIGAAHIGAACRVAAWHLNEARRFFGEIALPEPLADAVRVERWVLDHCRRNGANTAPRREVQNAGPVRDGKRLEIALAELAGAGRVRTEEDGRRKLLMVNPALMG